MTRLPANYDTWRLTCQYDDLESVGTEPGETCNRLPEPDEDAPRGHRPARCGGLMVDDEGDGVICDTCGAVA